MKGIVLAGGSGTRLFPCTKACSKQMLAVFDKPMIYYAINVLMLANIREILIISTPRDIPAYRQLLGDGTSIGVKFEFMVQEKPGGIAQALILSEDFCKNEKVCLILGDNVFIGNLLEEMLLETVKIEKGAAVFCLPVENPKEFGIVEMNERGDAISIEEKPENPKSSNAVVGLYVYDENAAKIAKEIKPSARGELEITSVNETYLKQGLLKVKKLGKDFSWFDCGNHRNLLKASQTVEQFQTREGKFVGCLEEVAFKKGWILKEKLEQAAKLMEKTEYGKHLLNLIN